MTEIPIQSLSANDHSDLLTNETSLSAADKQQILADWQQFWAGGFKQMFFTRALYRFLCQACSFGQSGQSPGPADQLGPAAAVRSCTSAPAPAGWSKLSSSRA